MIKMIIIFFSITVMSIINLAGGKVLLDVGNFSRNRDELTFEYRVGNNCDTDVWICQSVCFNTSVKQGVYLYRGKKSVRIRQAGILIPDNIVFETPVYGEYIRLGKGETYKGYVKLKLPLTNVLNWDSCGNLDNNTGDNTFIADKLIFELGVIQTDLFQIKNDVEKG